MKMKRRIGLALMCCLLAGLMVATVTDRAFSDEKVFALNDIPPIKNKNPIRLAVHKGVPGEDITLQYVKKWSEHTGINVTTEGAVWDNLFIKENAELIAGTGAYDGIVIETASTNEWAPYLWTMEELAEKYEPKGVKGLTESSLLKGIEPIMLRMATTRTGKIMGLPEWHFAMVMMYRDDVLTDPTERTNFKKRYGYDLAPAITRQQIYDQGEFFTRKKGELLKGKPLPFDIYGLGLMAGRVEANDELTCCVWGAGGHWFTVNRRPDGSIAEFVITKKDKEIQKEALTYYKTLLKFASPGCLNAFWDFVNTQFADGKTIVIPSMFATFVGWAGSVEKNIPGARLGLAPTVGKRGYMGCFARGVAKASKNPEATYWLIKYLASYQVQKELAEAGVSIIRKDVTDDPKYQADTYRLTVGMSARVLRVLYDQNFKWIDNDYYFLSNAAAKVYSNQIGLIHEGFISEMSVDKCIAELTKQSLALERKFGDIPVREEK